MKINVIAITLFLALSSFTVLHKYYVSVTDVEYAKTSKSLQVTSRIFIDDLENVLQQRYETPIKLNDKNADFYIEKYFSKKLVISVNDQKKVSTFIGKEFEDDMVHCYFEVENVPEMQNIEVTNKLLMDVYEEQQNITHININDKKKSFLLMKDNPSGMLKL